MSHEASTVGTQTLTASTLWARVRDSAPFKSHVREALTERQTKKKSAGENVAEALIAAGADFAVVQNTYRLINELNRSDTIRLINRAGSWGQFVEICSRGTEVQRKKVGADGAVDVYFAAQRGPDLVVECINGIATSSHTAQTTAGQDIPSFISTMTKYDGSPEKLRSFIACTGLGRLNDKTNNPFLAAQEVQILPGNEMPGDEAGAITTSGEGVARPYRAFHASNPSMTFVCGGQALLKILATFNPASYSRETIVKKRKERTEANNAFLNTITFADLFDDAHSSEARKGSRLIARHLEVLKDLQEHINALRGTLYGGGLLNETAAGAAFSKVRSYVGGTMWSYFNEQIDNLPTNIREAVELLNDPLVQLSRGEEALIRQGLLSYYLGNVAMISKTALVDLQSDLGDYAKTQKEHAEWFLQNGISPVDLSVKTAAIAHLTDDVRKELSIREVAQVYEALSFLIEYREKRNAEIERMYASGLDEARVLAKKFYMQPTDGVGETPRYEWRADSLSDTVPMGRLEHERVEVAKLFLRYGEPNTDGDKLCGALGRDDLSALQKLLQLELFGAAKEHHLRSYSADAYRDMVLRAVVAVKKCNALYAQLEKQGLAEQNPVRLAPLLKSAQESIRVFPSGAYALSESIAFRHGITAEEVLKRLQWKAKAGGCSKVPPYLKAFRVAAPVLSASFEAGIFPEKLEFLEQAIVQLKPLTPASSLSAEVRALRALKEVEKNAAYPHARFSGYCGFVDAQYFAPFQVEVLRKALEAERQLISAYTGDYAEQIAALRSYEGGVLVYLNHGTLYKDRIAPFEMRDLFGAEQCNAMSVIHLGESLQVRYVDPIRLAAVTTYLKEKTVARKDIAEEFFAKFELGMRSGGVTSLREQGIATVGISPTLQEMRAQKQLYVERAVYDRVIDIVAPQTTKPADGELIPRKVVLRDGEPVMTFGTANSGFLGKSMLDLPRSRLRWLLQSQVDARVKTLADKILGIKERFTNKDEIHREFWRVCAGF